MENLYDILGLQRNASDDEIKSAFKKLAIKWHPDKFSGKSDKEKKEAEEKFKNINLAKEVLLDKEKRAYYDRFGTIEGMENGGGGFSGFDFSMEDIMNMMGGSNPFGNPFGRNQKRGPEPGESIKYSIKVTLEEIYKGCEKEISYYIYERCNKCGGTGGDKETCNYCHGTGMITETRRQGFSIFQSSHQCPYCHGTGYTLKKKCNECNGIGKKQVKKTIKVKIPVGVSNNQPFVYRGMGCESMDKNGKNGDFIAIIQYNIDNSKYKIINNDVYELLSVPYYDAILGCEIEKKLPNGKKIKVKIPECSKDTQQIKFSGYGINNGSYIYVLNILLPDRISSKEKDLLKNIKKTRN